MSELADILASLFNGMLRNLVTTLISPFAIAAMVVTSLRLTKFWQVAIPAAIVAAGLAFMSLANANLNIPDIGPVSFSFGALMVFVADFAGAAALGLLAFFFRILLARDDRERGSLD